MSSSEDDVPLGMTNGHRVSNGAPHKSSNKIPASVDRALDKALPSGPRVKPGISIRNGPVEKMDLDEDGVNGANGKRKSRGSGIKTYREATSGSEDEDDKPLSKRPRITKPKPKVEDSDSDAPLASTKLKNRTPVSAKKPPKASETALGGSDDSDVPLSTKLMKQKTKIENAAAKEAKAIRKDDAKKATPKRRVKDESDDDVPLSKKKKQPKSAPPKANGTKKAKAEQASSSATPVKRGKKAAEESQDQEDGEQEEEYRWWEDAMKEDGTKKWSTLQHNGVIFPPPYESLPKNVRMKYDGVPVTMHLEAEEVAGFFGGMLNSTLNVENPTFQKNFFRDFKAVLDKTGGAKDKNGNKVPIKEFAKCDFKPIFEHYNAEREKKKSLSAADKKALKAEKDELEAPYLFCLWDGRKQKVGNFRVEPPGLFRGRGEHPKTGHVKQRVQPEQITINIGSEANVPPPPEGHRWKEVKHDQEGTWLAMWQENINGNYKYVMLAANADVKGQSDFKKFEKARNLKKHIDRIRRDYEKDLKAERMAERQRATAIYLIDRLALRAGNEKGEDEADTVGCCSLKYEHITLKPPHTVIFDFLGKDSIRFYDEVEVDPQVFKNLRIFKKDPKTAGDDVFDRLTTTILNKYLQSYMEGLTAKVFRTYNASFTFAGLLGEMKGGKSVAEMVKEYNDANRKVAILCNHKRTVTAGHGAQMEKMGDRIKGVKYQKWRMKQMILDIDPKQKKKRGAAWFELGEDLDKEWIKQHQEFLVDEQKQKIEKKFQKDNEKLAAEGTKEMKPKELQERLKATDELATKFKKENKSGKIEAEGKGPTVEKLLANIEKMDQRIANMELQAEDKENNKEVALGTSKINYIDPRLTAVFCKKFDVPIEKFFSKTLRDKFKWAIHSVDEHWEF